MVVKSIETTSYDSGDTVSLESGELVYGRLYQLIEPPQPDSFSTDNPDLLPGGDAPAIVERHWFIPGTDCQGEVVLEVRALSSAHLRLHTRFHAPWGVPEVRLRYVVIDDETDVDADDVENEDEDGTCVLVQDRATVAINAHAENPDSAVNIGIELIGPDGIPAEMRQDRVVCYPDSDGESRSFRDVIVSQEHIDAMYIRFSMPPQ